MEQEKSTSVDPKLNKVTYVRALPALPIAYGNTKLFRACNSENSLTSQVMRPRWPQRLGTGLCYVTCSSNASCHLTEAASLKSAGFRVQSSLREDFRKGGI